jgi:hypothetical protein
VDDGVGTRVLLDMLENTHTSKIVPASDHYEVSNAELDAILDLLSLEVELYGVVLLNVGVGVADGAAIMSGDEWHSLGSQLHTLNFAQLVLGFVLLNGMQGKFALDVEQKAEVLTGALNRDNI